MKNTQTLKIGLDSIAITLLTFLLIPLNLISHNTEDFPGFLYTEFLLYAVFLILVSSTFLFFTLLAIDRTSPNVRSKISTFLLGYLVATGLYFSIRSGLMDGTTELGLSYLSLLSILIILGLGIYFFEKKLKLVIWIALISAIPTSLMGLPSPQIDNNRDILSSGFFDVSTTGQNVFLISFDALQANHIQETLEDNKSLEDIFDGFIHFPNITAVSPFTRLSLVLTKLGYVPDTNIDDKTLIKEHSENFITNLLQDNNYKVSAYSYFSKNENENTISVHRHGIAPQNAFVYGTALNTSFEKYIPFHINLALPNVNTSFNLFTNNVNETNERTLFRTISNDLNNKSLSKADIISFNYYVNHLRPTTSDNTAHFHHYVFTHTPMAFDENCNYRNHRTVPKSKDSALAETRCALKKYQMFLDKLKALNAFDNSLIILASDHGHECTLNPPDSPDAYRVSKRWCFSRYTPFLAIKPFNSTAALTNNTFQASLVDISKTICHATADNIEDCDIYEGANLFDLKVEDLEKERKILVTKETADYASRKYYDFDVHQIGRVEHIVKYFPATVKRQMLASP